MPITKRKHRVKKRKKSRLCASTSLDRLGNLLAEGYGDESDARLYWATLAKSNAARMYGLVDKAARLKSWKFMDGCFKQASELYVLSSVLYERFPNHCIMSDGSYDSLARWLRDNFSKMDKEFLEWYTITAIDLEAGTGHAVTLRPPIVWMVYIITGEWIGEDPYENKQTPTLRRKVKRRIAKTKGKPRKRPKKKV